MGIILKIKIEYLGWIGLESLNKSHRVFAMVSFLAS